MSEEETRLFLLNSNISGTTSVLFLGRYSTSKTNNPFVPARKQLKLIHKIL